MEAGEGRRKPLPRVVVGAVGWTHPAWRGGFYPPDLPAGWRLAYYANEFEALWVPAAAWGARPAARAAAWAEALPAGFDLVAALPPEALAAGAALARRAWWRALERLAPWLRAVVAPAARDRAGEAARACLAARWPVLDAPDANGPGGIWTWQGGSASGAAVGLLELPDGGRDLRALRAAIEAFLAQLPAGVNDALLFLDAPGGVPVAALEAAETICRLLGCGSAVDGPSAAADTGAPRRDAAGAR